MLCLYQVNIQSRKSNLKNKILIIAGPTAVGKTALSINLAKRLNGEIISADSMQVYKGLDIGTAKPSLLEMQGVKHHMIDVCEPAHKFSVAQYVNLATTCVDDALSRGKFPIIVGGTGLYIDNLIYNNDFGEMSVDYEIRDKLTQRANSEGNSVLLSELQKIDGEYASKLHVNDKKRIIHALEIFYTTGKTQTELIKESRTKPPKFDFLYVVLDFSNRDILYSRINTRVDIMMEQGLLDEAKRIISSPWYKDSTCSQAIGYKEFEPYFNGEKDLSECVELLKQHSRNYAKRQLTWFRHKEEANFVLTDKSSSPESDIINLLKNN